jgi:Tfp pilus assembly protein PilN
MLRHNLATRPFYNTRLVGALILGLAVLVALVTLFNAVQFTRLRASESTVGAKAALAEQEAARLRSEAARVRAQIDARELDTVATAAREANGLIDRRAFSWTELFSHLEETLPGDVRVTAVQPRVDQGSQFVVGISVVARKIEDLDDFIEALETTGAFHRALAVQEQTNDDGLIEAVVEAAYAPAAPAEGDARE